MTKSYVKDSFRSIKRTLSRFLTIILIVALGSGVFVGINAVGPDMISSADKYYKDYNLMDVRLQSFIGLYDEDLYKVSQLDGVESVQGVKFIDGYVQTKNADDVYEGIVDIDGSELTVRAMGLDLMKAVNFQNGSDDPSYINRLKLEEGRYPEKDNECVVTCSHLTTPEQFVIGNTIKVVGDDEDISYYLKESEFTIVGIIRTPYWVSYERGVTTAGSGKLGDFIYICDTAFTDNINYYSEAYIKLRDSYKYEAYSEEYDKFVEGEASKIAEAAEGFAAERRAQLSVGLAEKIAEAEPVINQKEAELQSKLAQAKQEIEDKKARAATASEELAKAQAEMDAQYADAQSQLQSGSDQYTAAVEEYNRRVQQYNEGKVNHANQTALYNQKRSEADEAKRQLDNANTQLILANAEIAATERLITETKATLNTLKSNQAVAQEDLDLDAMAQRLEQTNPELAKILVSASNLTGQGMAADAIIEIEPLLDQYESELAVAKENAAAGQAEYDAKFAEWQAADAQLKSAKQQLDAAEKTLTEAEAQLDAYKEQINQNGDKLQYGTITAQTQYMLAQAQLALAATEASNSDKLLAQAEKQYKEAKLSAETELSKAKTELEKGKTLFLNIMEGVGWSVYNRHDSPGYSGYGQAADNMKRLGYIFPTFFFLIATMMCLTTMTRMVEEERTQLGTLKAIGYSNAMIVSKYIIYSSIASVVGAVVGSAAGVELIPRAIFAAWSMMYEFTELNIRLMPMLVISGAAISIIATVFAALLACRKELVSVPAVLMRPKPPKAGKRVFLENIKFIWKRLNFTSKVTVRNLFRNKKRFFVTVLGIAGCTALLVAACGLRESIGSVISRQYGADGIAQYDLQVVLADGEKSYAGSEKVREINNVENIEKSMLAYLKVCSGYSDRSDKKLEVDVLVPENPGGIAEFVNITKKGSAIPIQSGGVVITSKLAAKTNTKVGDYITLSWTVGSKQTEFKFPVTGIAENYTFHYVYMTPECFSAVTGQQLEYNYLFCTIKDGIDSVEKARIEKDVNNIQGISGTVFTTVVIESFNNIVNILNLIVLMFAVFAMALAFAVLYNLNNINVNERQRELATLKVLGFYNGEVSAYIYRENVFLTLFGIALGLVLGIPLDIVMISVIDIDTLTFTSEISALSFVISAVSTVIFAIIVNLIMHFKLKKLSMIESLKSVE